MKIEYYTNIAGKPAANKKCERVVAALENELCEFNCNIEKTRSGYSVTVETNDTEFTGWNDLELYVRNCVVSYNKAQRLLSTS